MPDTSDPLRALPRETLPPRELKQRVTATLRSRGRLRRSSSRVFRVAAVLAAAALLFIAGRVTTSRRVASGDDRPEFALLLYQDSSFDARPGRPSLYGEYSKWADGLNERGLLVKDRALDSATTLLRMSGGSMSSEPREVATDAGQMTGFFIIRAADLRAALAIAATCPHLKHGGTIALRPIYRGL